MIQAGPGTALKGSRARSDHSESSYGHAQQREGWDMTRRRLAAATACAGVAALLAACGAGSSSHVVQRVTPPTSVASAPTTTTESVGSGPGANPIGTTATTTATPAPSAGLDPQTLNQVAADLGALDSSLNTANSDLNNPQGDS